MGGWRCGAGRSRSRPGAPGTPGCGGRRSGSGSAGLAVLIGCSGLLVGRRARGAGPPFTSPGSSLAFRPPATPPSAAPALAEARRRSPPARPAGWTRGSAARHSSRSRLSCGSRRINRHPPQGAARPTTICVTFRCARWLAKQHPRPAPAEPNTRAIGELAARTP